jgi:outer membrane protein assembly factor BamB
MKAMKNKFLKVAVLSAVSLAATGAFAQTMFRGDAARTGVYEGAGPRELKGVQWKFATGGRIIGSPVASQGVIFVGSWDYNVYAVEAATGKQKWKFSTFGPVTSTPAVANGTVYFGSYDGKFYAVDEATGKLKWKFTTAGERRFEAKGLHGSQPASQTFPDAWDLFQSSPVVVQGAVYFGSGDGNLYALDAANGALRWKFATGDVVHASPAYANGTLYFGSWDSYLYAVDADKGALKWKFKTGEDPLIHNQVGFQSSPMVADGVVYVGCRDSQFYAIDAANGTQKWKFDNHGSWVVNSASYKDGKVIFGTSDSRFFHVLDAATGKPALEAKTDAYVFSSPAVAGDVAYVGLMSGAVTAIDLKTGKPLWLFQTDLARANRGWVLSADKTLNNTMLFHNEYEDGAVVLDRLFSIGAVPSSPLVMNGKLYVGSTDGYLYAIQ